MTFTRRGFFEKSILLASLARKTVGQIHHSPPAKLALDANSLAPFVDPLPIPATAAMSGYRPAPHDPKSKVPFYRIAMREVSAKVHRDLPATRFWSYGGSVPGPTVETQSNKPLLIEWVNNLPQRHFLPVDHTLHGAEEDKPEVRAVVHVHGAKVPPESDGYPETWYTPGKSATYYYPNAQSAAMLWYHDHTMGINRLNVYAGLFGAFMVRDDAEDTLGLPKGKYEIPLILCDRMFDREGQLYYPVSAHAGAPWMHEVFGDGVLVNGKLSPYLNVEARRYRFRVLNASNGRFYHLSFANGHVMQQIGSDQGLLPAPVAVKTLSLAPGERADLVVDFAGLQSESIVWNDVTSSTSVLQFRVTPRMGEDSSVLPSKLVPLAKIAESQAVKTRLLTLDEIADRVQEPTKMLLNNAHWSMPVTENPVLDSVEIWTLVNLTDDSHPIHLHMVRFQILDRRRFDPFVYLTTGELRYNGPAMPPEPGEEGWKDTVRAYSKMVTRIIIRFEGYTGRYVWHCHILEHEDNEMMRPYDVIPAKA